ncbi:MAG TPA: ferric reductase-like transmembrane domain-containing protein [Ktedonobacterales bacterium]|nr:ferric reductase-like transmembrane domain-containing protein [Ktedonobacterales bacterium]
MDILSLASAAGRVSALASLVARDTPSPTLWYVTRATAVACYITLSVSVALGVIQSIARASRERLPWLMDELHQVSATLTGVLLLGHLVALYFDPFLPFSLLNLLAPINEPYRPLGVAFGVFALYCMVALLFSSWLRRHVPYTFWRGVHYFSFVAFALVTAHGYIAGSDAKEPWMLGLYVGASCAVAFLLVMRLFISPRSEAKVS